jgi:hypothetical protein
VIPVGDVSVACHLHTTGSTEGRPLTLRRRSHE